MKKTRKWTREVAAIVDSIDDEFHTGWDTDSNIFILIGFIEEHCDQKEFEKWVRKIAKDEVSQQRE